MKIERLLGILTVLLQNDCVTAPYLAEKFEVNRRTIGRDIDALCQAGIPVVTRQGGGGGISIAEGYKLDKTILTTDELINIVSALKGIGSISDKTKIERTLEKLSINKNAVISLYEPIIIDLSSYYKTELTEKIEFIKKAICEKRIIEFDYFYNKGETHRCIEPYFVIFHWSAWYVFGYCLERKDWRLFKLQRLWNLILCTKTYIPQKIPLERKKFNAHLPDDKKLVALFDPSVKYKLVENYGLNCFKETDNGFLYLEIEYSNLNDIIIWLLGFGDKVKVIEPSDIANEIRNIAQKIFRQYD